MPGGFVNQGERQDGSFAPFGRTGPTAGKAAHAEIGPVSGAFAKRPWAEFPERAGKSIPKIPLPDEV
jgi:hypothetical protein